MSLRGAATVAPWQTRRKPHPLSKRYSEIVAGVFIRLILIACIGCAVEVAKTNTIKGLQLLLQSLYSYAV